MLHPAAAGERFIAVAGASISFLGMAKILARHLPRLADRVPARELTDEEVREGAKTDPALRPAAGLRGQVPVISSEKARTVLGWSPRDVEATITDTADSLIRLGLVSA